VGERHTRKGGRKSQNQLFKKRGGFRGADEKREGLSFNYKGISWLKGIERPLSPGKMTHLSVLSEGRKKRKIQVWGGQRGAKGMEEGGASLPKRG